MSEKKRKPKAGTPAGGKNASGVQGAGPMDVGFLQQLVNLMAANDLNTVDLRDSGQRIILKRGAVAQQVYAAPAPAAAQYAQTALAAAPTSSGGAPAKPATAADEDAGLVPIKSPMVGTFYSKPSPDAKAFVTVGAQVVKDETDVCIIEAMKTFNTLKSDVTGTVVRILLQDGQTVDVNKPLFLVKPS